MITLKELIVTLHLHKEGLSVSAIAERLTSKRTPPDLLRCS